MTRVGFVAIGRNEGERLVRCLDSLCQIGGLIAYVDSGSTDNSVGEANARGAHVVDLDTSIPFTAARARNAGYAKLRELDPELELVQFVDGDCELRESWLEVATDYLDAHPEVGIVAGRRRERFPNASPYNALADMEWDTPIGDATEIGGDALVRTSVFDEVDGYDPTLIAGEDPDFCYRVRRAGHRVVRLDAEMTLHDANIHRIEQWWKRTVRAGHAFAEGAVMHGTEEEGYRKKELRSILFWGGALPAASLTFAPVTLGFSLAAGATGYGLLFRKVYRYRIAHGDSPDRAALYAAALSAGKLAEMQGVLQFGWNRWIRQKASELIEYK